MSVFGHILINSALRLQLVKLVTVQRVIHEICPLCKLGKYLSLSELNSLLYGQLNAPCDQIGYSILTNP